MNGIAANGPATHGVSWRPAPGETRCGDRAVTMQTPERAMIAVIDGLGHGPHAAAAAEEAVAELDAADAQHPIPLMQRCHERLHRTRGAAITIVTVTAAGLEWVGVGNIYGRLVRRDETSTGLTTRPGIVGARLPSLRAEHAAFGAGDLLLLLTDGVDERATADVGFDADPRILADQLLDRHATGTDDALILVARLDGDRQ